MNGGSQPRWRKDGKELFYVEDNSLMAAPGGLGPSLSLGSPKKLFSSQTLVFGQGCELNYDGTADGQRFVLVEPVSAEATRPTIRDVQNWFAGFKDQQN